MVEGCDGLPALAVVVVTVVTATVTVVYLDHAINFRVGLAIHSSLLSVKSETKRRQNCIENFFRNPTRKYRRCTKNGAYVFDRIHTWKFQTQVPSSRKEDDGTRANPSHPPPRFYLPISSSQIRNKLLRGVVGSRRFFLSSPRREGAFTAVGGWPSSTYPLPPKNWLSGRPSRIPRRVPFAFFVERLSLTIKVRPPWFHVDRGNGEVGKSEKIQKRKKRNNGSDWKRNGNKDQGKGGADRGEERGIACLPGLFGDDFTPSINQPSPLLSLLPLLAPWQRMVWGDSP